MSANAPLPDTWENALADFKKNLCRRERAVRIETGDLLIGGGEHVTLNRTHILVNVFYLKFKSASQAVLTNEFVVFLLLFL